MRFPHPRLARVFRALQSETLPQDELARRFAVSTRTVRTDITALNALLIDRGVQLVLVRGAGYRLSVTDDARYQQLLAVAPVPLRVPRSSRERVRALLARFLTVAYALKLEAIADEWFISRTTLQGDMADVRDWAARYQLSIETRPRYGMKLFGCERAIRHCLVDLLCQNGSHDGEPVLPGQPALPGLDILPAAALLRQVLKEHQIRVSDESAGWLSHYVAVTRYRLSEGYPLGEFSVEEMAPDVQRAAAAIVAQLQRWLDRPLARSETRLLGINIAARRSAGLAASDINADDGDALVSRLLNYINQHFRYDLRRDAQLRADLLTHVKTMITRVRYQIAMPNPLLANIKQHYPMAWDVTLAAVSDWSKYAPWQISEDEIGFLVLHIGVGLERHYQVGYQRRPRGLLVCDAGTSTARLIEATLRRHYPQLEIAAVLSQRDYDERQPGEEDFIVSTVRLAETARPVVVIAPFPTAYQLEQIGKLVLVDRTRPSLLEKYFDAAHFRVIDPPISRRALFAQLCQQLREEGHVEDDFYASVEEREAIVSTLLGEGIALPHALGLKAHKTVVYTVLVPQGMVWGDGRASVIFLLAISKRDYEEAMGIYELFVTFLRERATARLRDCRDFSHFMRVARACLQRP
ncbi:transcription antiterminator [Pantoea sp. 1.19]|uniref:BglG family transcription antiterminator n=1 Tax=Pantoea sp. 1.19 TaxID=1925589 RepID=UPI000948F838|nr:PRD domain-containing protein [Pantoea sp. 1.19]